MEWLQSIPGQVFLAYYLVYLIILLLVARVLFWASSASPESVSGFDMISIAYLRRGTLGVIQTVFFDLWNRGLLEVDPKGQATIRTDKGPMNSLETAVAKELTGYLSLRIAVNKPRAETFDDRILPGAYNAHAGGIRTAND
ncbi:MAG TPA: hypothetical protein VN426_09485 [Syntrophomonadaceae bacterium]|nr:hypothetical protein [Syntrophomonadaceae bacterium]